jgi:hypothetical protein
MSLLLNYNHNYNKFYYSTTATYIYISIPARLNSIFGTCLLNPSCENRKFPHQTNIGFKSLTRCRVIKIRHALVSVITKKTATE